MFRSETFAVAVLGIATFVQALILFLPAKKKALKFRFRRYVDLVWWGSVLGIVVLVAYEVWVQYVGWRDGELTKFLLPPHNEWTYFLSYVLSRSVGPWIVALAAAFACGFIARRLNRRFGGRFFESEEPRLFEIGVFLSGYPSFLLYIVLLLLFGSLLSAFYSLRNMGRAPLYFLWLPMALFAIVVVHLFVPDIVRSSFNF